jgi:hypothetical protein
MTLDPESASLLVQAQRAAQRAADPPANGLAVSVTTDGRQVTGEAAVSHTADRWWVRAWATVTGQRGTKPQAGAGVQGGMRWLLRRRD